MVNTKLREAAHSYLLQKKDILSKLKNLSSDYQLKEYLQTDSLSTSEKQLLFKLRTRMIPVKCNFPSMQDDLSCNLCNSNTNESQEHVLICPGLGTHANEDSVKYMDIFDQNLEKQVKAEKPSAPRVPHILYVCDIGF